MPKSKEIWVFLLLFCIMLALFYRFTQQNTDRIQLQNKAYAEDAARQMALHLDDQFKSSIEVMEAYAFFINRSLTRPNVTEDILRDMEADSPFDGIRFTTPDGISYTSSGEHTDVKDRKFYTEGMAGKSGLTIIDSRVFHEPVLNFYAPIRYKGEIIGVLHGARRARTFLKQLLQASYFGRPADVFLCRANGEIVAASHSSLTGNVVAGLVTDGLLNDDMALDVEKVINKEESASFLSGTGDSATNLSIVKLPQFGYTLVQLFPPAVTQNMLRQANRAGVELELSLFGLFVIVAAILLVRAAIQRKNLEARNHDLALVTKGMNILFSGKYLVGNLDNGQCFYVGQDDAPTRDKKYFPYSDIMDEQLQSMSSIKEQNEFSALFDLENLRKEFSQHNTVAYSCRQLIDNNEIWENVIGICLNTTGSPAFLMVHQNINEMKLREMRAQNKIADMNRKERQYQLALTANAFVNYEFNISKNELDVDVCEVIDGQKISLLSTRGLMLPCRASDFLDSWQARILPESLQEYSAKTNLAWLRKKFYEGIQEVELDFWMHDVYGHEQCIRQSFYMAANDLTGEVMAMTVMRDITAQVVKQRSQTKALQDALLLAQHANEAKTTFLSNMSHDIRTPMNAIIGFATIAAGHLDNTNQVRDCLNKVLSSSNHLLSLINDILDMSRIESGKIQIKEQPCNLSDLMHNVVSIIQPQIKAKQMRLAIETFDVVNEDVITDPLKLNQVFINLLGNAVKYTPAGGKITFRMFQESAAANGLADYVFEVEDNGIGMSEEFVEHIFEPFTRATTTTQSGIQGTGLGMAITRNIIHLLHGHIEVVSEEGKGSLFRVFLTLRLQDEQGANIDLNPLQNERVLVIDDDLPVCDSVSKMLENLGLRAEWTTSGREAIYRAELAKKDDDPYRIFLVDWRMPEMGGPETIIKLRELYGSNVPIIILTAYEWPEIEDEAKKLGINAFCSKPLFMSDLKSALAICCGNSQENETDNPAVQFKDARILLVDDVEMNREVAEFILEESGFQVETAPDGTDAVEMVDKSPEGYYNAILMDVQMPTMNGYEATRTIRNLEREDVKTMPILAMTANALEEDKANALKCGMNDHIAKPIDIDSFFEILAKYLQRK